MKKTEKWKSLGNLEELRKELAPKGIKQIKIEGKPIALTLSQVNGKDSFGAIHGSCNHAGGPLGEGSLEGDYIVCPWHYWKFHRLTGEGEPGFEDDRVPRFEIKTENGELWLNLEPLSTRQRKPHAPHPLSRKVERASGPLRVVGISTTVMDPKYPRYSTSEALLTYALKRAQSELKVDTRLLKLSDLNFRSCEGFYSKAAPACTWPCSITQMDPADEMEKVYEALVHWADVILVATPIRWGAASSLYFKMAERLNCVQNQITLKDNVLIQNKVVGLIVTGGQDNVQAVAGSTLGFFAELGFVFPPFPYIAHSLGWTAENMQRNVKYVAESQDLKDGAFGLLERSVKMAETLIARKQPVTRLEQGGRKARRLEPGFEALAVPMSRAEVPTE